MSGLLILVWAHSSGCTRFWWQYMLDLCVNSRLQNLHLCSFSPVCVACNKMENKAFMNSQRELCRPNGKKDKCILRGLAAIAVFWRFFHRSRISNRQICAPLSDGWSEMDCVNESIQWPIDKAHEHSTNQCSFIWRNFFAMGTLLWFGRMDILDVCVQRKLAQWCVANFAIDSHLLQMPWLNVLIEGYQCNERLSTVLADVLMTGGCFIWWFISAFVMQTPNKQQNEMMFFILSFCDWMHFMLSLTSSVSLAYSRGQSWKYEENYVFGQLYQKEKQSCDTHSRSHIWHTNVRCFSASILTLWCFACRKTPIFVLNCRKQILHLAWNSMQNTRYGIRNTEWTFYGRAP